MNKRILKTAFANAKAIGAKYIAVKLENTNNGQPEIITCMTSDFDRKLHYYMNAYPDDLVGIPVEKHENSRITGIAYGNTFEDIELQLMPFHG